MSKSYVLLLTSAIAVDGEVMKKGDLVEVSEHEAKNLLHRGKAVLHIDQPAENEELNEVPLTDLKAADLKDIALQLEIEGADKMTKEQLVEAITAAQTPENKPEVQP